MFFSLFSDLFFQLVLMLMILDIHAHNDKSLIIIICTSIMGWIVPDPSNQYVEALTLSTLECNYIQS